MAINLNNNNNLNNPQNGLQPQQPMAKPRTSGFTNIQNVLNANKGNKLGQTIGSGVQNITNKVQGQTQNAQQQYNTGIGQAQADINKGNQVKTTLGGTDNAGLDFSKPDQASQAIGTVGSDEYAKSLANLRAGYKGPTGLQNQEQLQNQAQDLQQTGQSLQTAGGKQAALQRFVNSGPGYTSGQQRLDTLLLGQGNQNNQALNQARRSAQTTAMDTGQAINTATQQGQQVGQQYTNVGQDVGKQLTSAEENFRKALNDRVSTQQQAAVDRDTALKNRLKMGSLTQEDADFLSNQVFNGEQNIGNLTGDQLGALFNTDINKYNVNNVSTDKDVMSRNALAKLAGIANPQDLQNIDATQMNQPVNATTATDVGMNALKGSQAAAAKAQQDFMWKSPDLRQAPGITPSWALPPTPDYYGPGGGFERGGQLNYQQTQALAPYLKEIYSHQGINYDQMSPEAQAKLNEAKASLLQKGKDLNLDTSQGWDTGFDQLYKQYNDTNNQYGIGRKLSDLMNKPKLGSKG